MKWFIAFVVFIAVLFLASYLFLGAYKSPQILTQPEQAPLSLTCAIVVSDAQRQSGTVIPRIGLGEGPQDLGLVRPVGDMLSGFLLTAAQGLFRQARLVTSRQAAEESDVVVELVEWKFKYNGGTGYDFTGLPLLFATGKGFVTLYAEFDITGNRIVSFTIKESAKGTRELGIALFPASRLNRTMTEASEKAAAALAQNVISKIVIDSRVNMLKTIKQQVPAKQSSKQNK